MTNAITVPLWIDGKEVNSSTTFANVHGITREASSNVAAADADVLNAAIASNKAAFRGWADTPAWQRRDVLNKFGDLFAKNKDELFRLYSTETPVSGVIMESDFGYALSHIREAASICTQIKGDIPVTADNSLALVLREPYGCVLSVTPFNFAATLTLRALVYPIACGNTVLCKASDRLPGYCLAIAKLFKEAGLPDGVLNLVQFDAKNVAARMEQAISHPDVRMINFTGSVTVGRIVAGLCGKVGKPILLELGGKAPAIVMPSADLEVAVNNILFAANAHGGQICMSTEIALVHQDVYDRFVEVMQRVIDSDVDALGEFSMINAAGASKPKELWADALSKGAKVLTKHQPSDHEAKIAATVMTGVTPDMKLFNDESFGPNVSIVRVKDAADAIEISNGSGFGLSSSIFTNDIMEGLAIAKLLETGAVHLNSGSVHDEPTIPHGGHKNSGHGRFNGAYAIQSFTQTKTVRFGNLGAIPLHILKN